jgi:MinD superfamily P-loop ATPase
MADILVISGKGGTGKTSISAAFSHLAKGAVLCDLDVDAPDLHLILRPEESPANPFISGFEAKIDPEKCTRCGTCEAMCRFLAVRESGETLFVDPIRCEGCGVCFHFCPEKAISFDPKECGVWRVSDTRFGPLVHAQLYPGEENSGKLVAHLRRLAKQVAEKAGADIVLSDGPPGIGCPVISALSGIDVAVIVTEPTPSGLHDMKRVVELCGHFRVATLLMINKSDLSRQAVDQIKDFAQANRIEIIAEVPHDPNFVHAMIQGAAITEYSTGPTAQRIQEAWDRILARVASL